MQDILTFIHNHLLLNIFFLIVLFSVIMLEFMKQKQNSNRLSPLALTQLINHDNAVILDLRDQDAYNQGHIIGSVSMTVDAISNSKKLEKYRSRPIVLVCATGTDSSREAAKLSMQGFDARVLDGGMRNWREANMPTVKG